MKGVLLINMGGPESREELKTFLSRMFRDPYILPFWKPLRYLLAFVISSLRYKQSWKKYELIGGTPLVSATRATANALQESLGAEYAVKYAFSYSMPDIPSVMGAFHREKIHEITAIPLYPQASFTTTSSVIADLKKITDKNPFFKVTIAGQFYDNPAFISFWANLIREHLVRHKVKDPTLFFSAHSIPERNIDLGDTYASCIEASATLIAGELGLPFEVAYQSGMRRGKWIGPDVKERLQVLRQRGLENLVMIPISFVHENLETRYDLDLDIVPYALKTVGFSHVSRVELPEWDERLVGMLRGMAVSC